MFKNNCVRAVMLAILMLATGVPAYGDTLAGQLPTVLTHQVLTVSSDWADISMEVTNDGGSDIYQRGIVYSRTNAMPVQGDGDSQVQYDAGGTGKLTVRISGLIAHSTYYARAFAINRTGTAYGSAVTVYTSESNWYGTSSAWVATGSVTDVKDRSAVLSGYLNATYYNNSYQLFNYTERGVVYSSTNYYPTVSDSVAQSDTPRSDHNFKVELTGLRYGTNYCARAYVSTPGGYSYGEMVFFTTEYPDYSEIWSPPESSGGVPVSIIYKTRDGSQIGRQELNVAPGTVIKPGDLDIPTGYLIINKDFSYKAKAIAMLTVTVDRAGVQLPFMAANGSLFEPDRNITRIEVARMLHSLRGSPNIDSAHTFTDVPAGYAGAAAIRYVTGSGFMAGYTDGTFRPGNDITRAEVAVIVNSAYALSEGSLRSFNDMAGHWAEKAVSIVGGNGLLSGYPNGGFKPDSRMTRAEACALFSRAEKRNPLPLGTAQFADVPPSHWAYRFIMNAAKPVQ